MRLRRSRRNGLRAGTSVIQRLRPVTDARRLVLQADRTLIDAELAALKAAWQRPLAWE